MTRLHLADSGMPGAVAQVQAQPYPMQQLIKIVVPYPPGATLDTWRGPPPEDQ